jgi:GalNAc5-diNAcBac-PP-undecaprenol beta-1,3-glucosyltransferase
VSVAATIIVPTHDHGPTLRAALASALAQTVEEIAVFVIGDGVPDITREIVADVIRSDERVRFVDHPKGARNGEAYRHAVLEQADGEIVCYLSDDDLWFPDHVATMRELLAEADFAAAVAVHFTAEGERLTWPFDLACRSFRERMLAGQTNFVPLSCGAHTRDAYRRLPQGWSTTPEGMATDLFMWQKFLQLPGIRARSATRPTVLHFPSSHRRDRTQDERVEELERWAAHVVDPARRNELVGEVLDRMVRGGAELDAALAAVYETRTWRLRQWVLGAPVLRLAAKALAARAAGRAGAQSRRVRR